MKSRIMIFLLSLMTTGILLTQGVSAVYAQGKDDKDHKPPKQEELKNQDKNHEDEDDDDDDKNPPGQNEECKPGWGKGDKNHKHCGPPGHSTPPGGSTQPPVADEKLTFAWVQVVTDDLVDLFNSPFFDWLQHLTGKLS